MAMEKSLKNNQRKRFKYNNNHFKMMIEILFFLDVISYLWANASST